MLPRKPPLVEPALVFGDFISSLGTRGWSACACPEELLLGAGFFAPAAVGTPGVVKMDLTGRFRNQDAPLGQLRRSGIYLGLISLAAAVFLWWLVARYSSLPSFMLPSPQAVGERWISLILDGSLLRHTAVTLMEILVGLTVGVCAATASGYFLAKSRTFERLASPYIVASQSVPIVAIAPLLVIWFGPGVFSKVLICALIVFFPVLINTIVGLRSVPEELQDLMRSLQATRWQTVRYLELPAAMPVILGGVRIGATLAVIGAVVGEFAGSDRGLGFMINVGRGQYDTAQVFVAVFTLVLMALCLYGSVLLVESRWLSWRTRPDHPILTQR